MSLTCDRCGSPTNVYTMSYFNTDSICMECEELEKLHPLYHAAKEAEIAQVERGNFNYEGVGLPPGYREWARAKKQELAELLDFKPLDVLVVEESEDELDLKY